MAAANKWLPLLEARLAGARDILVCRSVKEIVELRSASDMLALQRHGRFARVGFVPTMGALHRGHTSLLDMAASGVLDGDSPAPLRVAAPADLIVSSIFVNPTQFAPTEDLGKYPRTWEEDLAKLRAKGVHAVFAPTAAEMYPPGAGPFRSFVTLTGVDSGSPEGGARPGFFRGVATVVTKLLNIVRPTDAYFGQKDGVQCIVVRTAARDLNTPVRIHIGATVREEDGLAMSSRNVYLSSEQRAAAPVIYRALQQAVRELEPSVRRAVAARPAGPVELSPAEAERRAQQAAVQHNGTAAGAGTPYEPDTPLSPELASAAASIRSSIASTRPFSEVQYVTFSCGATGRPIASLEESQARNGAVLLSVAAKIGATRLLDNVVVGGRPNDLGWPAAMPDWPVE